MLECSREGATFFTLENVGGVTDFNEQASASSCSCGLFRDDIFTCDAVKHTNINEGCTQKFKCY